MLNISTVNIDTFLLQSSLALENNIHLILENTNRMNRMLQIGFLIPEISMFKILVTYYFDN